MSEPESVAEARRWWRYAIEDLTAAELMVRSGDFAPRLACSLAQQAVEKALKAALLLAGVAVPRHHNLNALRNLLPDGWNVTTEHPDLSALTYWAVEARYPGDLPEATAADAHEAAQQARNVVDTFSEDIRRRGFDFGSGSARA